MFFYAKKMYYIFRDCTRVEPSVLSVKRISNSRVSHEHYLFFYILLLCMVSYVQTPMHKSNVHRRPAQKLRGLNTHGSSPLLYHTF